MAAYPLIDDDDQLVALDGWLVNVLHLAMKKRQKLLTTAGLATTAPPYGMDRSAFVKAKTTSARTGETIDMRIRASDGLPGSCGAPRRSMAQEGSAGRHPTGPPTDHRDVTPHDPFSQELRSRRALIAHPERGFPALGLTVPCIALATRHHLLR